MPRMVLFPFAGALFFLAIGCAGTRVSIPPPGTDTSPPTIAARIVSLNFGVQHDFDQNGDHALLYPPKGDVTFVIAATDPGGVANVRLFDSCDPATCAPVAEANGDRSNPLDTLQVFFAPDVWTISR